MINLEIDFTQGVVALEVGSDLSDLNYQAVSLPKNMAIKLNNFLNFWNLISITIMLII